MHYRRNIHQVRNPSRRRWPSIQHAVSKSTTNRHQRSQAKPLAQIVNVPVTSGILGENSTRANLAKLLGAQPLRPAEATSRAIDPPDKCLMRDRSVRWRDIRCVTQEDHAWPSAGFAQSWKLCSTSPSKSAI